tara:strand:+ start:1715 stop:3013 length:1299 start_codon:yes stop_codon:yes gene_type:complete
VKQKTEILNISDVTSRDRQGLLSLAEEMDLDATALENIKTEEIAHKILRIASENKPLTGSGLLEIMSDGYGFLRQGGARANPGDVYVSQTQIRRVGLKSGDFVQGQVRPPKEGERYFGLVKAEEINGNTPQEIRKRISFEKVVPVFPDTHIKLETVPTQLTARMIDLFSPIGRGQRGMIVSPPKAGKTTVLKDIAAGTTENFPDIKLMVVLIGERPEEVTDMTRSVKGEVFSSTFDESVEDQCRVAELALERAKRQVENGQDVMILLDSITRLTRAYNLAVPSSGRTLSGGIDPVALYPSKRFFGAARNVEHGGSLTIIATCLVDTGSRMDDVIYEEFKGTGNLELHLERKMAERRIFPAIDIQRSGTRREDLLYEKTMYSQIMLLRRMVGLLNSEQKQTASDATMKVLETVGKSKNNVLYLEHLNQPNNSK